MAEACGSRTRTLDSQLTANDDVAASAKFQLESIGVKNLRFSSSVQLLPFPCSATRACPGLPRKKRSARTGLLKFGLSVGREFERLVREGIPVADLPEVEDLELDAAEETYAVAQPGRREKRNQDSMG
jgi:hypothetical protein